jgi:hypothetical protein
MRSGRSLRSLECAIYFSMGKLRPVVVVMCCWLFCFTQAQELWANTRAGMTPDEVVQVVPNAYRTTGGADFKAFDKWPGMTLQAEVDHVEVLGARARAMFGFIDNGLGRVVLSFSTDGMSMSAFESQCRTFRAALNSRYGPEGSVSEERSSTVASEFQFRDYQWFSGQTQIKLTCTSRTSSLSPDSIMILGIYYHHVGSSGL